MSRSSTFSIDPLLPLVLGAATCSATLCRAPSFHSLLLIYSCMSLTRHRFDGATTTPSITSSPLMLVLQLVGVYHGQATCRALRPLKQTFLYVLQGDGTLWLLLPWLHLWRHQPRRVSPNCNTELEHVRTKEIWRNLKNLKSFRKVFIKEFYVTSLFHSLFFAKVGIGCGLEAAQFWGWRLGVGRSPLLGLRSSIGKEFEDEFEDEKQDKELREGRSCILVCS